MYRAGRSDDDIASTFGGGITERAVAIQRSKMGLVCRQLKRRAFPIRECSTSRLIEELKSRGYIVTVTRTFEAVT